MRFHYISWKIIENQHECWWNKPCARPGACLRRFFSPENAHLRKTIMSIWQVLMIFDNFHERRGRKSSRSFWAPSTLPLFFILLEDFFRDQATFCSGLQSLGLFFFFLNLRSSGNSVWIHVFCKTVFLLANLLPTR